MKDMVTIVLIVFLLVTAVFSIYQTLFRNSSVTTELQKPEGVETMIPTHIAKCTETIGHVCTTYTIYRITTP